MTHIYGGYDQYDEYDDAPRNRKPKKPWRRTYSDPQAKELIERRIGHALTHVEGSLAEVKPLHLEPILNDDDDYGVYLSFLVGAEKLYVVKNLPELQYHIINSGLIRFGTKTDLWVEYDAFDEKSKPLVDFFLSHYYEETINRRSSYYYSSSNATPKKMMPVTQVHMDALFGALVGQDITYKDNRGKKSYRIVQADPAISLTLTRVTDGAILEVSGGDHVYRGSKHIYVFIDDMVYVCSEPFSKSCVDVLKAFYGSQGRGLFFHESDIPVLLNTVLDDVEGIIPLTYEGDFDEFITPPLSTRVYFDVDDADGCIIARMVFSYGDNQHDAFEGKTLDTSLDIKGEVYAEELLVHYMGTYYLGNGTLKHFGNESDIYELATEGISMLMEVAELYMSESFNRIKVRPPIALNVGVKLNGHLLDIDFDIDGVDYQDLADSLAAYRQSKKYIRLRDGSFLTVDQGAIPQVAELLDGLSLSEQALANGHIEVDANRALYLDALLKRSGNVNYTRDEGIRRLARMMQDIADADYQVPTSLEHILRDYQQVGYRWLRTLEELGFGGILADDMGLGKTLQVLTLLQAKAQEGTRCGKPSLVICPASLVLNWVLEANRFTPDLHAAALLGSPHERQAILAKAGDLDVIITSYDQFRRNVKDFEPLEFDLVILDEAQRIKNQNTQASKAVKRLNANTRLALTGTPIENSLAELWSIFDFIMPDYLRNYSSFKNHYETPIIKKKDPASTERLKALVRPFILRRLKGDVLKELPEKIEKTLTVPLPPEQQKLYLGMLAQVKRELAERLSQVTGGQGRIAVLAALTRMRQVCCDPSLVFEGYTGDSAKRAACLELIASCQESGHRMLLFSQFTSMLDILERDLDSMGIAYYRLDGSTPTVTRQRLVERFNTNDVPIFLISLRAGGTGLNLTGADAVIHYDPWWNLSVQNQATDRTHRIGQRNVVQVFKLIAQGTIEERIQKLQEQKADLANEIILEGDNAFDTLTSDELMALFEEG